MFDFKMPFLDRFIAEDVKFRPKLTVLHRRTCPICDRKLVNVYWSNELKKYICKKCMDKLLREKGGGKE